MQDLEVVAIVCRGEEIGETVLAIVDGDLVDRLGLLLQGRELALQKVHG